MRRKRTHSILVLTAVVHLLADMAFAGGSVLCVGPDNHAEIEVGYTARACRPAVNLTLAEVAEQDSDLAFTSSPGCVDFPLHVADEMVTEDLSWDFDAPPLVATMPIASDPPSQSGPASRIGQVIGLTPTMRAHRSIVLIV